MSIYIGIIDSCLIQPWFIQQFFKEDLFISSQRPATSCLCTIDSGPADLKDHTEVIFDKLVSEDDIVNRFQKEGIDNEKLKSFYIKLFQSQPFVLDEDKTGDWLHHITSSPFRDRPFIQEFKRIRPIFGIDREGLRFTDCPGTNETSHLYREARNAILESSVVVYIFDASTPFSSNNIQEVKNLMDYGIEVLFIFNVHDCYTEDDISTTINELKRVLGHRNPSIIEENLLNPKNFAKIEDTICKHLIEKARSSNALFLQDLYELLRVLCLLVTRIISHSVDQQLKSSETVDIFDHHIKETKKMVTEINFLEVEVKDMVDKIKVRLRNEAIRYLKQYKNSINLTNKSFELVSEYENPAYRSFLQKTFTSRAPTAYEKELYTCIDRDFASNLDSEMRVQLAKIKNEFYNELVAKASTIYNNLNELKKDQVKIISGPHFNILDTIEKQVLRLEGNAKRAIPITVAALSGVVGSTVLIASLIAGALATTVLSVALTGGASLFGILGLSGLATLGFLTNDPVNEEEARIAVLDSFYTTTKKNIKGYEFSEVLGDIVTFSEATLEYLRLNVFEIDNIIDIGQCDIQMDYQSLCEYLKMKSNMHILIDNFHQEITKQGGKLGNKEFLRSKAKKSKQISCYICERAVQKCNRLCRKCDYLIGSNSCPHCVESGKWIAEKIKFDDAELSKILSKIPTINELNPEEQVVDPFQQAKKHVMMYKSCIKEFCEWLLEKNKTNAINGFDELKSSINSFVLGVVQNYKEFKKDDITAESILEIVNTLHEVMFSSIGDLCSSAYRKKYKNQDEAFLEICIENQNYERPKDALLNSEFLDSAIFFVKRMLEVHSPSEKFTCIKQMAKKINEAQDKLLGADDFWDSITYVFLQAQPESMVSEMNLLSDMMSLFVEYENEYLLTTVHAITNNFQVIFGSSTD